MGSTPSSSSGLPLAFSCALLGVLLRLALGLGLGFSASSGPGGDHRKANSLTAYPGPGAGLLDSRIEVATPINSWQRLQEGAWLLKHGLSPFSGNVFHSSPLLLYFLSPLSSRAFCLLTTLIDLASGLILFLIARATIRTTSYGDIKCTPPLAAASTATLVFFLNPLRLAASAGASTSPIHDFFLLSSLLAATWHVTPLAACCWLLACHLSLSSASLCIPLCLLLAHAKEEEEEEGRDRGSTTSTPSIPHSLSTPPPPSTLPPTAPPLSTGETGSWPTPGLPSATSTSTSTKADPSLSRKLPPPLSRLPFLTLPPLPPPLSTAFAFSLWVCLWAAFLLLLTALILQCSPLSAAACLWREALFTFNTQDLTPNTGLRWYFFAEVFPDVRTFFSFLFFGCQMLLVGPLTLRLHRHPLFLTFALLSLSNILAPYPSVSDYSLATSFIPLFLSTFEELSGGSSFVVLLGFVYAFTMGPIMFDLWCLKGIGNANFYYAVTLLFAAAQGLFLVQTVWAQLRSLS